jgi:glycosyltransferase involved in cell wall biosynthesis
MQSTPRCTVIVPTYNRVELLRHTLDTLLGQTLPPERFQVVVADDGSSDGTERLVASYAGRLDLTYCHQPDEGFRVAKARNLGLRHARGPVAVFVDSGVMLGSRALEAHCGVHEAAAGPTVVIGYTWGFTDGAPVPESDIDPADVDGTIRRVARDDRYQDKRELYYGRYGERLDLLAAPWVVFWTCNASADTALVRQVGAFDEAFTSWGGEDTDLGYRLHRAGATFVLAREAAALHYPHAKENIETFRANNRYFARKYDTPVTRLRAEHDIFGIEQVIRDRGLAPDTYPHLPDDRAAVGGRR